MERRKLKVLTRDQLMPKKGISYSDDHLRRMEKKGQFPKSFPLGPGRVAYDEEEIDDWLVKRAATRTQPANSGKAA